MPRDSNTTDRRRFLQLTGGAALATTLAGCTGNGDGDADPGDGDADPGDGDSDDNGEDDSIDYPTDDIRWVIPYSTGGGFDTYSRGTAEFMPEYLPNDVDIRPENVPGAGGRTGANEIYRADPDGYTIGIFNVPGMVTTQLVQDTEYDLTEIEWIGRLGAEAYILSVGSHTDYRSLQDLQEADEVSFAVTGAGGTSDLITAIGTDVMDINTSLVSGYEGSAEARTGVIRGDADARMTTYGNAQGHIEDGDMVGVIALDSEAPDFAPDAQVVTEEGYDELAGMGLQRPVGAPPDTPGEVIDILEDSLEQTVQSDEMQEWAEDQDRPLNWADAEETAQIIENTTVTFDDYRDILEDQG